MKYETLKKQNNLHWYIFDNGKKLQANAVFDLILNTFDQKSELTIAEIAEKIKLNKNDTTHLVRRLTTKDLLGRQIRGNKNAMYFIPVRCLIADKLYNQKKIISNFKIKSIKKIKAL